MWWGGAAAQVGTRAQPQNHRPRGQHPSSRITLGFSEYGKFCNWHFFDPYEPFLSLAVLRESQKRDLPCGRHINYMDYMDLQKK